MSNKLRQVNDSMPVKQRDTTIDIMRGILIILVILGHAIDNMTHGPFKSVAPNSFSIVHDVIYSFHMPAFFILSGMFIHSWAKKPWKEAIIIKIIRFVLPYFSWTLIVTIIKNLTSTLQNNPIGWDGLVKSPIVPFEEYWFLYDLFIIEVFYYVFTRVVKVKWGGYCLLIISTILLLIQQYLPEIWVVRSLCQYLFYFSLGTMIDRKMLSKAQAHGLLVLIVFVVSEIVIIFLLNSVKVNTTIRYYCNIWLSLVGFMSVYYVSATIKSVYISKFISFAGVKSMEIYCIHPMILGVFRIVADFTIGARMMWPRTIMATMICLISCLLIFSFWKDGFLYRTIFGTWKIQER